MLFLTSQDLCSCDEIIMRVSFNAKVDSVINRRTFS